MVIFRFKRGPMSNVDPGVRWGKVIAKQMDKYCGRQSVKGLETRNNMICSVYWDSHSDNLGAGGLV